MTTVGFFGLGAMGYPMAEHLIACKKYKVIVYNRNRDKALPLKEKGGIVAESIEQAIKDSDVLICMLFDKKSIEDVFLTEERRTLLKGKVLIQMSTISPEETVQLKQSIEQLNGTYLEAPVLGTSTVAVQGQLQVFVGSTKEQFEKYKEYMQPFASTVRHIGEIPAGSILKLGMNQMVLSTVTNFATTMAYMKKSGLSTEIFMDILKNSAFFCKYHEIKYPSMDKDDFSNVLFDVVGAAKDAKLICDECKKLGLDTSTAEAAVKLFTKAAEKYSGNDFAVVYKVIANE